MANSDSQNNKRKKGDRYKREKRRKHTIIERERREEKAKLVLEHTDSERGSVRKNSRSLSPVQVASTSLSMGGSQATTTGAGPTRVTRSQKSTATPLLDHTALPLPTRKRRRKTRSESPEEMGPRFLGLETTPETSSILGSSSTPGYSDSSNRSTPSLQYLELLAHVASTLDYMEVASNDQLLSALVNQHPATILLTLDLGLTGLH